MTESYEEQDFTEAAELVGKRRRYFRRPKRPGDLLGQLMARKGFSQQVAGGGLEQAWKAIVGESFVNKTKVARLNRNVLEVFVKSSVVNQQLSFNKQKLLAEIRKRLPKEKIKDIKFKIGTFG